MPLDLSDETWRIYSRTTGLPPHYIGATAHVQNSMISEGGDIHGTVESSLIFAGVTIEEGATVRGSIVMPGTVVKAGATVQYAIVAENAVIGENAVVGELPEAIADLADWGVAVVAAGVTVAADCKVPAKAMIDKDVVKEDA